MEEKYFTDFINIHFMLVHDGADFAAKLTDPRSRAANMITVTVNGEPILVTDWMYDLRNKYDITTITLKEAVNRDSENVVSNSGINNSETLTASNLKDIAFSVEIPITKFNLNANELNSLKLYSFSHLDVARLERDFNLSAMEDSILKLLEIGGNFKQDLILEKEEDELRVPDSIDILTFMDGTPFNGSYHYHGTDNPGPDGYIGWMEGPAAPHMLTNARRLQTKSIQYSKVVANFLFDDRFFISEYNGAAEEMDALENNYNSPWVQTKSTYDAVFEADNGYSPDTLIKIYDPEFQQDLISKTFENQNNHTPFDVVYNAEHSLNVYQNGTTHELEFEVNYEKLIKIKSKFPLFIKRMEEQFGYTKQQILNMAKIKRISISRYRLSNSPRSNNPVCTADYDTYDTDEIDKTIAVSSQEGNLQLVTPVTDDRGRYIFQELESNEEGTRRFKVRDWDLAENVNFGKYAYRLDISIDDSIKNIVIKKVAQLRFALKEYQKFLFEAPSNLKFATTTYTDEFIRRASNEYGTGITALINQFVSMHGLLGNLAYRNRQALRNELKTSIAPASGDIATANRFADHCQDLIRTYEEMLKKDNVLQVAGEDTSVTVQSFVKLGNVSPTNTRSNSIEFSRRIPGHTEAYVPGDLFVSYGLSELLEMRLERIQMLDASSLTAPEDNAFSETGLWAAPTSVQYARTNDNVIEVFNANDWARQSEYDHMRWTSRLDNIVRTPIEDTEQQIKDLTENVLTSIPTHGMSGMSHMDPARAPFKQFPGDVNTSMSPFKSPEDKTGLTELNEKAITAGSDSFDVRKDFDKNNELNKKELNKYSEKSIYEKLEEKITKALQPNSKSETPDFFKQKKSKLLMKVGKSAQAEYVEVTKENLGKHKGKKVKVKVASTGAKSSGESYKAVNTTAEVSTEELSKALKMPTQTSLPTAGAGSMGTNTYNL